MQEQKLIHKEQEDYQPQFMVSGQVGAVGAVVALIIGVGVAVLVLILVGVLGGKAFQITEADINEITNTTVRSSVKNSIVSGFEGLEQTGELLPLIVLAIVMFIILSLVLGFSGLSGGGRGGGTAL